MTRFPVLHTISLLLKGFAVFVVLVGVLGGLMQDGAIFKLLTIAGVVVYGVLIWAFAELIGVALAIESNTYETQQALIRQAPANRAEPANTPPPLFKGSTASLENKPGTPYAPPPPPPPPPDMWRR